MRVTRSSIPNTPSRCEVKGNCVYRVAPGNTCDEPRINKGNDDAACHLMSNAALVTMLTVLALNPKSTLYSTEK